MLTDICTVNVWREVPFIGAPCGAGKQNCMNWFAMDIERVGSLKEGRIVSLIQKDPSCGTDFQQPAFSCENSQALVIALQRQQEREGLSFEIRKGYATPGYGAGYTGGVPGITGLATPAKHGKTQPYSPPGIKKIER